MPPLTEKSRWSASPAARSAPVAVTPKPSAARRDVLAIVAGAAAIAALGVAVWQGGDAHEGVSLRADGSAATTGADLTQADGGWQDMAREQAGDTGAQPSDVADPTLVAETRAEHEAQTQAFAAVLRPVMANGAIKGFVLGNGAAPAVLTRAGVKPGDVILAVNGLGFQSTGLLADLSQELAGSRVAEFIVERDGTTRTLTTRIRD